MKRVKSALVQCREIVLLGIDPVLSKYNNTNIGLCVI